MNKILSVIRYKYSLNQLFNYAKYKLSKKKETLNYRPIWTILYLSDLCNLKCKMCPHHAKNDNDFEFQKKLGKKFISLELVTKIYEKFPETILVMLGGVGEPTLHPKFKEIVELTAKNRKKINLITNGTLLTDDIMEYIVKEKYFNQISVSLNASNESEYQKISDVDKSYFYVVVNNIKKLVELKRKYNSKIEIVVSGVCSKEFVNSSYDFLKFCDSLGVDRIDLHRYIDFDIHDSLTDIDEFSDDILKIHQFASKNIKTRCNLPHQITKTSYKKGCDWFFKNISFDSYGNIGSCGRVISPDSSYGNIEDDEDIWNNKYMQKMRRDFIEKDVVTKYCKKCIENHQS